MPRVNEANNNNVAVTSDTSAAEDGPISSMSFPVVDNTRPPSIDPPMPNHGATNNMQMSDSINVDTSSLIPISFRKREEIGPAALATLFAPIEKAT